MYMHEHLLILSCNLYFPSSDNRDKVLTYGWIKQVGMFMLYEQRSVGAYMCNV